MTPWTAAGQAPLSLGFSKQEYWSGLPFPAPGYSASACNSVLASAPSAGQSAYSSFSDADGVSAGTSTGVGIPPGGIPSWSGSSLARCRWPLCSGWSVSLDSTCSWSSLALLCFLQCIQCVPSPGSLLLPMPLVQVQALLTLQQSGLCCAFLSVLDACKAHPFLLLWFSCSVMSDSL